MGYLSEANELQPGLVPSHCYLPATQKVTVTRIGEEGEAALGGPVHFGFLGRLVVRAVDPDAILNPMSN